MVHRHLREGNIDSQEAQEVLSDFKQDEGDGVWAWLPVSSSLISPACRQFSLLPSNVFLRAIDAIHLACAKEEGLI